MIGSVVSHYRVLDRLGAGGMGVVYRAEDMRLGRHVALKFLPESAYTDPLAIERFQREARTTSALNHPNICTLHDVGEHDGRRFIVMELIDGATLDKVLGSGALPVDRVIDMSISVADALDAAHSEGILHRDIKPGNIFITKRGQVKVVDFGLAKMMPHRGGLTPVDVTLAEQHTLTSAGMAVGTVAYMSPEHARGEAIDQRSDLFSLGVVMYEMATGVQTFKGQTTAVIFDQILNRVPVPPSQINPDVIPSLEHIIARLLEKERERRYQSSRDVQADLQRLRRDLDVGKIVTADASQTTQPTPQTWAPHLAGGTQQTVAVNVPTFGVDADPMPVPAAWAAGWDQVRPPSHPGGLPAASRPAAASAVGVLSGSTPLPAAAPDSGSAPTMMVPASGASRTAAPPPVPPPLTPAAPISGPVEPAPSEFDTVLAYVPNAPDAETVRASTRREEAKATAATVPHLAAPELPPPVSVPAVWTTPASAAARPRQGLGGRAIAVLGAGVLVIALASAGVWWMLRDREVAVSGATDPKATVPPAPAPPPAAPVEPTANPFPSATATPTSPPPVGPAPPATTTAPRPTGAKATGTAAATVPPPVAPGKTTPPPTSAAPPSRALQVQAAALLAEAQGLLQSGAEADGLAKIAALRASFGGTPQARDGALLAARTQQKAGRFSDAAAAWIDAARDGVGAEEISEGLIQAADGAARQRTNDGDVVARRTLGDLLDHYPGERARAACAADEDVDRGSDEAERARCRAPRHRAVLAAHAAQDRARQRHGTGCRVRALAARAGVPRAPPLRSRRGNLRRPRHAFSRDALRRMVLGRRALREADQGRHPRPRGVREGPRQLAEVRGRPEEAVVAAPGRRRSRAAASRPAPSPCAPALPAGSACRRSRTIRAAGWPGSARTRSGTRSPRW